MGDKIAYDRRYYAEHREELLRKKRQKRANASYRERENKKWSEWYRRNAEPYKIARSFQIKIEDAREIVRISHR